MVSRIEQIIDEIEDYIDNCKPKLFTNEEIIVNKEEIDELLRELRNNTPDEIKRCQKIISQKEAILEDARSKGQDLMSKAEKAAAESVSEHEIMQQAYASADAIIKAAQAQAQDTVNNAMLEANAVKNAASQYMDDVMGYLDQIISSATQTANSNYESLIGQLNHYGEIIRNDRAQLHPEEYIAGDDAVIPKNEESAAS
ncbi:MAG: vacuolar family H+-ATPase subunit H [Lachnospiraceae bacterium]|nr:vacuolar family H+-ATPase subunit H [Lachnospiraceae bacterium]